jgi:hypothetical protein
MKEKLLNKKRLVRVELDVEGELYVKEMSVREFQELNHRIVKRDGSGEILVNESGAVEVIEGNDINIYVAIASLCDAQGNNIFTYDDFESIKQNMPYRTLIAIVQKSNELNNNAEPVKNDSAAATKN